MEPSLIRLLSAKAIDVLLFGSPGTNPDSTNIWAPLHIPNIGFPFLDSFFNTSIMGSSDAMTPALDRSS